LAFIATSPVSDHAYAVAASHDLAGACPQQVRSQPIEDTFGNVPRYEDDAIQAGNNFPVKG
jgi:hypothetical protein